jgi:hypothetical protein
MASVSNFLWVSLFIWGARMTIMSHAEIFASLSGGYMILYRLISRLPISKTEILASIIAYAGAFIISLDKDAQKVNPEDQNIVLGNLICLLSSLFGALSLEYSENLLERISVVHILFFQSLLVAILQLPFGYLIVSGF